MKSPQNLSKTLANLRVQLRTGRMRSMKPRPLSAEEVLRLEQQVLALETEMRRRQEDRAARRLGAHIATETDRVISSVQDANAPARAFFQVIGGAASPEAFRLQIKALMQRARAVEREAKKKATELRRAEAKKEREKAKADRARGGAKMIRIKPDPRQGVLVAPKSLPEIGCGCP